MPSSTVQRERLVTPLNLAVMLGLFAVAFWVLKPDAVPGGGASSVNIADSAEADQLDLAYLKAQKAAGNSSDADVINVFTRLLRGSKLEQAQQLLRDIPGLSIDEALRYELDLELAALESPASLQAVLQQLIAMPRLHTTALLARATQLGKAIPQSKTSLTLFKLSANAAAAEPDSMVAIYQDCGRHMAANAQTDFALACYRDGLNMAARAEDIFAIRSAVLPLLEPADPARAALVKTLMDDTTLNEGQLSKLASTLLSIERPDMAYRLYGRLALQDADASEAWLPMAARWAQAAGQPDDAAVFLDALADLKSGDEKRDLEKQVEALLLASGKSREAYARMKLRVNADSQNVTALNEAVLLARQLGDAEQALQWNERLLAMAPEDQQTLSLQRELALSVGDLPLALSISHQLVELDADNVTDRQWLAQISEWDGDPLASLQHWLQLSQARNRLPISEHLHALREVVRLAELTLQPGIAVKALRELSLIDTPTVDDAVHLLALYVLDGRANEGAVAIRDIIALHGPQAKVVRALALHEYHHSRYQESLDAWQSYVEHAGLTGEATLARMELLWRLDRKDQAAQVARQLRGLSYLAQASDYQLRLMAEISWRYRMPWLALGVQPRLDSLEVEDQRILHGRRALETLLQKGKDTLAMQESIKLWDSSGDADFALLAMQLAIKVDNQPVLERFAPQHEGSEALRARPAYWSQVAAANFRAGDAIAARVAYGQALALDANHRESIAGLLWMAISERDEAELQETLQTYKTMAQTSPDLWQAMAVGYLQLGAASASLVWFDKLLDQVDTDYNMLLTYADALEYAGRSSAARDVRQYTLQQLRPLLINGTQDEQSLLLRQYARLSSRYGSVESNEQLIQYLLSGADGTGYSPVSLSSSVTGKSNQGAVRDTSTATQARSSSEDLWREEMAISWLMATQQHEHARIAMARIHADRIQAPVWQQLALALKDNDKAALQSLVVAKGPLSIGNHVLALRQLGREREAYALARQALVPGMYYQGVGIYDRQVAAEQLVSLRGLRPSYVSGGISTRMVDGLTVTERGVNIRHSLMHHNLGLSLALKQRQLSSDQYRLDGSDNISDVALALYFGNSQHGFQLTSGVQNSANDDLVYGGGRYAIRHFEGRHEASAEFAYNESIAYSPELLIAGMQSRVTLGYDADFAKRSFLRLRADATEVNTRVERSKLARGLGGSVELGVRGAFGSNAWSSSVQVGRQARDLEDSLPEELQLSSTSTLASMLAEDERTLSFGGSLSRGGVASNFPQASTPRYYLNARVARSWPQGTIGLQVDAGAGIRVLGGDELSFSVAHDTQPIHRNSNDTTSVGMHYRYHFQ